MPHKPWYKIWWKILLILIALFLVSFLVAATFYVFKTAQEINQNQAQATYLSEQESDKKLIEGLNNYSLGTSSPKLTIVEFGDFACPICQASFSLVRETAAKYPNDIKIIWRDFPMPEHAEAVNLAMAARCAGEQNKFWAMHDKLFSNQGVVTKDNVNKYALQIGVDIKKFSKCFTDRKYFSHISQDYEDAQALGVGGTPTWFFNNRKVPGYLNETDWFNLIDLILKK
jgi:protein-disulfide isomerase